jgi:6-phosphogluconolactonase
VLATGLPELARAAAAAITQRAEATLAGHDRFRIALAGGSTPRAIYPALVDRIDWSRAEVFFGDERAVRPTDPQSNYRMARETLLDPARVPSGRVFRWRAEDTDLDAAARDYESALRAGGPPWLDLALLGLGPDGHTASLFPGTAGLAEQQRLAVAVDVPAMGARRLTLTYPAFNETRAIFFMIAGHEKARALADALRPESTLPAARVLHGPAPVTVFCDQDAASLLPPEIRANMTTT